MDGIPNESLSTVTAAPKPSKLMLPFCLGKDAVTKPTTSKATKIIRHKIEKETALTIRISHRVFNYKKGHCSLETG
jgi:hypothetical protein